VPLPITTKRLIIRPFTPADFEAIHAVWSDPAVIGPIPSPAYDRDQSWARLTGKFRHQARHGFSKWAVTMAASGTVIGEWPAAITDNPGPQALYRVELVRDPGPECRQWATPPCTDSEHPMALRISWRSGCPALFVASRCGQSPA
jgi:hypothetical protein